MVRILCWMARSYENILPSLLVIDSNVKLLYLPYWNWWFKDSFLDLFRLCVSDFLKVLCSKMVLVRDSERNFCKILHMNSSSVTLVHIILDIDLQEGEGQWEKFAQKLAPRMYTLYLIFCQESSHLTFEYRIFPNVHMGGGGKEQERKCKNIVWPCFTNFKTWIKKTKKQKKKTPCKMHLFSYIYILD